MPAQRQANRASPYMPGFGSPRAATRGAQSLLVREESLAGRAADAALGDDLPQERRGAVALFAQLLVERVKRREHEVELDRVGPLERPARPVVAEAHRDVDVLG